jgi:hypothetical protein
MSRLSRTGTGGTHFVKTELNMNLEFSHEKEKIRLFLKLFELQTINALMNRRIQPANLKALLCLVKGADQDWSHLDEDLD